MNRQFILLASAFAAAVAQASVLMVGKTDKPPLSYKCGEELRAGTHDRAEIERPVRRRSVGHPVQRID